MHHESIVPSSGKTKAPPPDGGFGWVVVFASFMVHLIVDGLTFSAGVYMKELSNEFGIGLALTSGVISVMAGLSRFSGPSTGILVSKWGARWISAVGSLLASLGLGLSYFAHHVGHLYVTFGILIGLGRGLIYLPAIVIVSSYFERKRAFATGMSMCGSGIGGLAFPPLQTWLISLYGWRFTLVIASGIQALCILFSLLYKPLPDVSPTSSTLSIVPAPTVNEPTENPKDQISLTPVSSSGSVQVETDDSVNSLPEQVTTELESGPDTKPLAIPVSRDLVPVISAASTHQLLIKGTYSESMSTMQSKVTVTPKPPAKRNCCERTFCNPKLMLKVKRLIDFTLLKRPVFIIFAMSNFLYTLGFNTPFVYIVDLAVTAGAPEGTSTSFLLSIIGIAGAASRLVVGYLSDKPWIKRFYLYIAALVIGGLSTGLASNFTNIITLRVYAAVYGVTTGVYIALTSVLLVDLLGLKKLSSAYGFVLFSRGAATFIGSPAVGKLYDDYGEYRIGFWMVGGIMIMSSLMLFFIPCLPKVKKGHKRIERVNESFQEQETSKQ